MTHTRHRHPPVASLETSSLHPSVSVTPGAFGRREAISSLDRVLAAAIESFVAPAALVALLRIFEPDGDEDRPDDGPPRM
jgi:hypothetical protein